jgi:hypothetical protein
MCPLWKKSTVRDVACIAKVLRQCGMKSRKFVFGQEGSDDNGIGNGEAPWQKEWKIICGT